jgi:soluble lytic murein transglycosylase-like protein
VTWDDGQVDQLDRALRAHQAAEDELPHAQARAKQIVADARAKIEATRIALAAAIVDEYERGARQVELIRRTGYSRERMRQILRAGGVEPD